MPKGRNASAPAAPPPTVSRLKKALDHWRQLGPLDPAPLMDAIPYRQAGSKYGTCGIRIDGTRLFIDAVLGNLKTLLALEDDRTRLELNYTETKDRQTQKPTGNWVCYVRLHQRGGTNTIPGRKRTVHKRSAAKAPKKNPTWTSLAESLARLRKEKGNA